MSHLHILETLFFISLSIYAFFIEPRRLSVTKVNVKLKDLPPLFNDLRILHLSDLHSKTFGSNEKKILALAKALQPHFIFATGDFIDSKTYDIQGAAAFWQELSKQCKTKVYGVLGNHDWTVSEHLLEEFVQKSGIIILENTARKIYVKDSFIWLVGVDDPATHRDDLEQAMRDIKEKKTTILLAHSPDIIDKAVKKKIDLVLAGHLHGGQIKLPFIPPFYVWSKHHGKYASGLYHLKNTALFVNRGVGMSVIPARFNALPEIAFLTLKQD